MIPGSDVIQDLGLPQTGESVSGGDPPMSATLQQFGRSGAKTASLSDGCKDSTTPFVLSAGLAPVPPKLVARIQKMEFVDMAELLRDNLELQHQMSSSEQLSQLAPQPRNRRREIPDILSWVSCFGVYMAVLTAKHPEMIRQLLAYQTLIVREARRCGGNGWLAYDTYFRQQVAGDPSADWSSLNTSLYAVTFLAQGGRGSQNCATCMESDHSQHECAISQENAR